MSADFFKPQPLGLDGINGLTTLSSITQTADFLAAFSTSGNLVGKVLPQNMFGGWTAVGAGGSTGYVGLPYGFFLQWISGTSSSSPVFTPWPRNFSAACYAWVAQPTNQVTGVSADGGVIGVTHVVSSGTPLLKIWGIGR